MLYPDGPGRKETELHHHLLGQSDAVEGVMAWRGTAGATVEAQPDEGLAGVAGFAGSMKVGVAWM